MEAAAKVSFAVRVQFTLKYPGARVAFGARLADQGMIQQMIADNEIDLAATRALLQVACQQLDNGPRPVPRSPKTFAAQALHHVGVDAWGAQRTAGRAHRTRDPAFPNL